MSIRLGYEIVISIQNFEQFFFSIAFDLFLSFEAVQYLFIFRAFHKKTRRILILQHLSIFMYIR